jgi:hypothetical protein
LFLKAQAIARAFFCHTATRTDGDPFRIFREIGEAIAIGSAGRREGLTTQIDDFFQNRQKVFFVFQ